MERIPEVKLFKPLTKKNGKTYPAKTWWIRYWQNGKHVRESTGTANERVARRIAAEKQAEIGRGRQGYRRRELGSGGRTFPRLQGSGMPEGNTRCL